MARYGMVIDLKSCSGCKACMTACKANHDIPFGEHEGREYYRIWPLEIELGAYPYVIRNMTPMLCMQCQDPPCVDACPVPGAIYRREDGIVLVDQEKCDGCKLCLAACPYGALYSRADKGVVDKCTFCFEGLAEGFKPECVKACTADAMFFGDLDDAESPLSKLIKEWNAQPFEPEHGTKPSVFYRGRASRLRGTVESKKTGHAIRGAAVTAAPVEGGASKFAITDADGIFFFWDLEGRRKYSLSIEANGFSPHTLELYLDEEYRDLGRIFLSSP
jgi:Fe-S-cluster-containing dehydrogenase component